MLKRWAGFFTVLILGIVLAIAAILPPRPQGSNAAADQFSASRAMDDVRIIANEPHPTGSAENAKVRTYLKQRLHALGLETRETQALLPQQSLERLNSWSGENATEQLITNIIGIKRGKDSAKPALLLMAHHDTSWDSPGAADDTIGLATILEVVRALNSGSQVDRDLIVLFTDAEEIGLVGARYFFERNPFRNKVGAIINFEARGGGGTANMFQTSAQNGNAARLYAKTVKEPSASSLSAFVYNILPNDTDLTAALEGDYVAYNIANLGRAEYYHSPKITPDALELGTLQHMGSQALDLSRALLKANTFPAPRADATYFDVFGFFTVIYSAAWGWFFLSIAAVSLAFTYDKQAPRKDILTASARMSTMFLLGGGLLYGLNILSGPSKTYQDYYDRLAGFAGLALFFALFGRGIQSRNGQLGLGLMFLVLGVVGQIFAPTATYFITIPVMFYALTIYLEL